MIGLQERHKDKEPANTAKAAVESTEDSAEGPSGKQTNTSNSVDPQTAPDTSGEPHVVNLRIGAPDAVSRVYVPL